MMPLVPLWRNW